MTHVEFYMNGFEKFYMKILHEIFFYMTHVEKKNRVVRPKIALIRPQAGKFGGISAIGNV